MQGDSKNTENNSNQDQTPNQAVDALKKLQAKTQESWIKTYKIGEYAANPQVLTQKIIPMVTDPSKFWQSGMQTITDGELILGVSFLTLLCAVLSAIANLSPIAFITTIVVTMISIPLSAGVSMIVCAVFCVPQKTFNDLVRVAAASSLVNLPVAAIVNFMPGGFGIIGNLAYMALGFYIGWHVLTKYLMLSQKQALIFYGAIIGLCILIPLIMVAMAMFAAKFSSM